MSEAVEEDDEIEEECEEAATWIMTFADLMSLLMCFFVLLLSFSEIEASKLKLVAASMAKAFGVQRETPAIDQPKGTSIIMDKFSPGKPEPTVEDVVKQQTTMEMPNLEIPQEDQTKQQTIEMQEEAEETAAQLTTALSQSIEDGKIEVEVQEGNVIIRINEKGSFPSGTAELQDEFVPTLSVIAEQLKKTKGTVEVAGHTDDIPISTFLFRSNWELASARAVSVLHELLRFGVGKERVEVKGLADSRPLVPNDSRRNRARNRRVEIIIRTDKKKEND